MTMEGTSFCEGYMGTAFDSFPCGLCICQIKEGQILPDTATLLFMRSWAAPAKNVRIRDGCWTGTGSILRMPAS